MAILSWKATKPILARTEIAKPRRAQAHRTCLSEAESAVSRIRVIFDKSPEKEDSIQDTVFKLPYCWCAARFRDASVPPMPHASAHTAVERCAHGDHVSRLIKRDTLAAIIASPTP